jgi:hypothetical protein
MSNKIEEQLKRYEESVLPPIFHLLSEEDKVKALNKIIDSDIELSNLVREKRGKSKIAADDLQTAIDLINELQDQRKVFSIKAKGDTGSGSYEMQVRGGDTNFIYGVALAVIAVVAAIFLLLRITS